MKTIAKFRCTKVTLDEVDGGSQVEMEPVYSGSEENEKFFSMTPYGKLEMGTVNPDIKWEEDAEYYIEIRKAE